MIERMLLFGATGDLTGRLLLPALAALHAQGSLPRGLQITGASRESMDDEAFRSLLVAKLAAHAPHIAEETRATLPRLFRYQQVDFDSPELDDVARKAIIATGGPLVAYLALPPVVFARALEALDRVGLPPGSRVAIEKPFGNDLDQARSLNALAHGITHRLGDSAVFRVDHLLGMPTVQNFIGLRLANRAIDALWHNRQIETVEILWEETLALEGRAAYYDRSGALKDVMQNHMMQLLALVAMEPPVTLAAADLGNAKAAALHAVRPPSPERMRELTRRARYTAGVLPASTDSSVSSVPDYADEEGVDDARQTETFAEVVLTIDTPRWIGTRFVMRAGKALRRRRKEIVVTFRPIAHGPFAAKRHGGRSNALRIGIDGPDDITWSLTGRSAGPDGELIAAPLHGKRPSATLPPYGHVLLNLLSGDSSLAVRANEAEEAWRIVTPVLESWRAGEVPLEEYPAGSDGPAPLLQTAGHRD